VPDDVEAPVAAVDIELALDAEVVADIALVDIELALDVELVATEPPAPPDDEEVAPLSAHAASEKNATAMEPSPACFMAER
jgi:hypothetical protein